MKRKSYGNNGTKLGVESNYKLDVPLRKMFLPFPVPCSLTLLPAHWVFLFSMGGIVREPTSYPVAWPGFI